jgi:hypothetical protein
MSEKKQKVEIKTEGESRLIGLPQRLQPHLVSFLDLESAHELLRTGKWIHNIDAFLHYTDFDIKSESGMNASLKIFKRIAKPMVRRIVFHQNFDRIDARVFKLLSQLPNLTILKMFGYPYTWNPAGFGRWMLMSAKGHFLPLPNEKLQQLVWHPDPQRGYERGYASKETLFKGVFDNFQKTWHHLVYVDWDLAPIPVRDLSDWISSKCVPRLETLKIGRVPWVNQGLLQRLAQFCPQLEHIELFQLSLDEPEDPRTWFKEGEIETLFMSCKQLKFVSVSDTFDEGENKNFVRWSFQEGKGWNFYLDTDAIMPVEFQLETCFSSGKLHWNSLTFYSEEKYDPLLYELAKTLSLQKISAVGHLTLRGYSAPLQDDNKQSAFEVAESLKAILPFLGHSLDVKVNKDDMLHPEEYKLSRIPSSQNWSLENFVESSVDKNISDYTFHEILLAAGCRFQRFKGYANANFLKEILKQKIPMDALEVVFYSDADKKILPALISAQGQTLVTFACQVDYLDKEFVREMSDRKKFPALQNISFVEKFKDSPGLYGFKPYSADDLTQFTGFQTVRVGNMTWPRRLISGMTPDLIRTFCHKNPDIQKLHWTFDTQDDPQLEYPFAGAQLRELSFPCRSTHIQFQELLGIQSRCPQLQLLDVPSSAYYFEKEQLPGTHQVDVVDFPKGWNIHVGVTVDAKLFSKLFQKEISYNDLLQLALKEAPQKVAFFHEKKATAPRTTIAPPESKDFDTWYSKEYAPLLIAKDQSSLGLQELVQELAQRLLSSSIKNILIPDILEVQGTHLLVSRTVFQRLPPDSFRRIGLEVFLF